MNGEKHNPFSRSNFVFSVSLVSLGATILASFFGNLHGQEAVRMSVASSQAAEVRRRADSTAGYYNLRLGPTAWRFGSAIEVAFNDNVENQQLDREGDLIFRPQLKAEMNWPLSVKNNFNLSLGAGYSFYMEHPNLNRLFLTPGSQLGFDVYVGDFWINFHDRFSLTEDAYQDPTVSRTGDFARFENAVGATALWDLNKVILKFGCDHATYISLGADHGQPDGNSEVLSISAGYALKPAMLLGVELGAGLLHYNSTSAEFPDANQWNVGVFYDAPLSAYMNFRGSVGYTVYQPDNTGLTHTPEILQDCIPSWDSRIG